MRSLCKRDINRIILFPLLLIIIVCTASVQGRGKDSKDLVENGGKGGKTQAMELRSGAKGRGSSTAEAPSRWRLCLPAWMSRRQQAEDKGICGDKGKGVAAQASAASAGGGGKDDDAKKGIPRPSVFVMLKDIMLGGAAKDRGFDLASWLSKGGHLDSASGPLLDTPLIVACHSGCIEAAEALIKVTPPRFPHRTRPSQRCMMLEVTAAHVEAHVAPCLFLMLDFPPPQTEPLRLIITSAAPRRRRQDQLRRADGPPLVRLVQGDRQGCRACSAAAHAWRQVRVFSGFRFRVSMRSLLLASDYGYMRNALLSMFAVF